ncbi:PEP-CTERM sorting domain-containing protein [Halopseudomonas sabulinigri]
MPEPASTAGVFAAGDGVLLLL